MNKTAWNIFKHSLDKGDIFEKLLEQTLALKYMVITSSSYSWELYQIVLPVIESIINFYNFYKHMTGGWIWLANQSTRSNMITNGVGLVINSKSSLTRLEWFPFCVWLCAMVTLLLHNAGLPNKLNLYNNLIHVFLIN